MRWGRREESRSLSPLTCFWCDVIALSWLSQASGLAARVGGGEGGGGQGEGGHGPGRSAQQGHSQCDEEEGTGRPTHGINLLYIAVDMKIDVL